ncbi:MAG: PilZ domain-containing protein [Acidobacteria bacterium]|nr:PilZ domain-containing protein [Acidobacteriota bacterium]MBV9148056.1 PilZ domain-containing protein [Acidobacteriota bacterium]MBV9437339.1 PilZ domain-containing protein [Acidobacteriota bacterium]
MTTPEPAQRGEGQFIERRREPRHSQPAAVKVKVSQEGGGVEFDAIMIDSSSNGLAIRHWRKDLNIGRDLRIRLQAGPQSLAYDFLAQVVWNWSVGPVVISGLERVLNSADRTRTSARGRGETSISSGEQGLAGAGKSRSWIFAVFGALLIVAGWYFRTRF